MNLKHLLDKPVDYAVSYVKQMLQNIASRHPKKTYKIFKFCANNIFFWLDFIVKVAVENPHSCDPDLPETFDHFIMTRNRKKLITKMLEHIDNHNTLLVQKTKSLGATTSALYVALWHVLFTKRSRFVIVCPAFSGKSFSSCVVSLFRQIFKNYELQIQHRISLEEHCDYIRFFTVTNHFNQSSLILVSSHKPLDLMSFFPDADDLEHKVVIFDEMAFHKKADAMWHSLDNTDITRIAISSPNGKSNLFYELVSTQQHTVHTMHWFHEPRCDKNWYQQICENNDPVWVEQYINIDYNFKCPSKSALRAAEKRAIQRAFNKLMLERSETFQECYRNGMNRKPVSKKPETQNICRQRRKPHRNPKDVTSPADFKSALNKFVSTSAHKQITVSEKTSVAIETFKINLADKEPRLLVSLPEAIKNLQSLKKTDITEIGEILMPHKEELASLKTEISFMAELLKIVFIDSLRGLLPVTSHKKEHEYH